MISRFFAVLATSIVATAAPQIAAAQSTQAPPPVVTRPGGEGNVSRYEYAPENQPSLQYKAPGTENDLFGTELDILRERVRDLEIQMMQMQDENRRLKAHNETLMKAQAATE